MGGLRLWSTPPTYTASVLAMERTHLLRADLDWIPRKVRRSSRLIRGATWTTMGVAVGASLAVSPMAALLWKGVVVGGAGAAALADRVARKSLQKQISKLSRGELPLSDLDARDEGELVVVRGVIDQGDTLRGLLIDAEGVFRRMVFKTWRSWVHEAAVDFTLVDAKGDRVAVQAAGARWLTKNRELVTYPGIRFADAPSRVRAVVEGKAEVEAIERVLTIGTEVQVVGYKTTSAAVDGVARDYRMAPQRATLQSGPELPLAISRIDELP